MNKIKKISVLLVLAIFLISIVPAALAGPNEVNNQGRSKKAEQLFEGVKEAKPKVKELTEKAVIGLEKVKKNIEMAKENYQKAKERYQLAKQKYTEVKENVSELRNELKECAEEECEPKRKQFREKSRDVLIHLSDVVLGTLDKLKEKIELSEMTDEEKTQALADLDIQITEVQEAKTVLENLSDDLTKDEIKDAIKVIKDAWSSTKPQIKLSLGKLVGAKLGNIIVKTEQLETKFNNIRNRLETNGQDVSALDDYLEEFNGKLTSAKEHWETAREQFGRARTAEDISAAVKEAHQHQTQARNLIKEAREDIRNIVRAIKGLEAEEEEIEETLVEEEETENEEDEVEEETAEEESTEEENEDEAEETPVGEESTEEDEETEE